MKKTLFSAIALLISSLVFSQIQHGGAPLTMNSSNLNMVPVEVMTVIDEAALRAADLVFDQDKSIPWRFGENIDVAIDMQQSGLWEELPNGDRVWLIAIHSVGAQTLNFRFEHFFLPAGASMYLYNEDGSHVLGAFNEKNNHESKTFATTLIRGEKIFIEVYEPLAVSGMTTLKINRVTHGYRSLEFETKGIGDSGNCNNNSICAVGDDWRDQIRSVGIMLSNGAGFCTGSLINNTCVDGKPYFLTANHCVDGNSTADFNAIVINFNFESTQCNTNTGPFGSNTVSGTTLRASNSGSDFALLELNSDPPSEYEVYYSGWDRNSTPSAASVGIHHPSGDLKKISFDDQGAGFSTYNGADTWQIFSWEDGTTEGGSSGSALFNPEKRIVGQLYGGQASCGNNVNDYYGRFDISWDGGSNATDELKTWLDACNTGVNVLDGYDPNVAVVDNDVKIEMLGAPVGPQCGFEFSQVVRISNKGVNPVTSVTFMHGINGSTETYNWTGNLSSNQSEVISLSPLNLLTGTHIYQLFITMSNFGATDENPSNDNVNYTFVVENGTSLYVQVNTPFFNAGENYFELLDGNGNIVETEGNWNGNTTYTFDYCLPNDDYCLVMYDTDGDGMGTGFFAGDYSVSVDGDVVHTGGDFGAIDSTCFTAFIATGIRSNGNAYPFSIYPNPSDNILNISLESENEVLIHLFNSVGQIVFNQSSQGPIAINVSDYAPGIYFVQISGEEGRATKKLIIR